MAEPHAKIAGMASITVCGSADDSVAPDRATLELGLTYVAITPSDAMATVATQSQVLEQVLTDAGFAAADWSTQEVILAEEWEWKNDTNTKVGFRASAAMTVRIVDLDRIAALLRAVVDDADAQVRDLHWAVSDHHPARSALLGAAALDAVHRADAYAEALGLQRGAVEEVSDLPLVSAPGPQPMAMMARSKAADNAPALSVSGGRITLHASVYVRFTTLPR